MNNITTRFKHIMGLLKKKKLASLPWFLVLGQTESGKSTLLKNAGQHYVLAKKIAKAEDDAIKPSQHCDWWVTQQAVFLDIPGRALLKEQNTELSTLGKLIKRYKRTFKCQGILLIIDLHDLLTRTTQSNTHRLNELLVAMKALTQSDDIPVHILFNKSDLLTGFTEFFSDLGAEFRAQPWGFTLSSKEQQTKKTLRAHLSKHLNTLIKQLNEQLIWRLHHERDENSRLHIKNFPIQYERIKPKLMDALDYLISGIIEMKSFSVNGIYFTSSTQPALPDGTAKTKALSLWQANEFKVANHQKTFFVKDLLLHIINTGLSLKNARCIKQQKTKHTFLIWACAIILIGASTGLYQQFTTNLNLVTEAQGVLNAYQHYQQASKTKTPTITQTLDVLEHLRYTITRLQHENRHSLINKLVFSDNERLLNHLQNNYHNTLNQALLPAVISTVEEQLNAAETNDTQRYIALTLYLMLGDKAHFDQAYITSHFSQSLPDDERAHIDSASLQTSLDDALKAHTAFTLNESLISETKQYFNDLPLEDLAFVLLNAESPPASDINLTHALDQEHVLSIAPNASIIPGIYTAKAFTSLYPKVINQISQETLNGNWILGNRTPPTYTNEADLAAQLKARYIKAYGAAWVTLLSQVNIAPTDSLNQETKQLDTLSGVNSPLLTLLTLTRKNMSFPEVLNVTPELNDFIHLLDNVSSPNENLLYQTFSALHQLNDSLVTLAQANNTNEAAYTFAHNYLTSQQTPGAAALMSLLQLTPRLPEPLQHIVKQATHQAWQHVLLATREHINHEWKTSIVHYYRTHLSNRYPFKPNKNQDASLSDFATFFGKSGLLEMFEEKYIYPFVIFDGEHWKMKPELEGMIRIPNIVMDELQRYAILQQTFFAKDGDHPNVAITLQPTKMSSSIASADFIVGSLKLTQEANLPSHASTFHWPTPGMQQDVTIRIVENSNETLQQQYHGPWAFMRAINDASSPKLSVDRTISDVMFAIGDTSINYELTIDGSVNPFSETFMQRTWLPLWVYTNA